jgi:hypothetical protein
MADFTAGTTQSDNGVTVSITLSEGSNNFGFGLSPTYVNYDDYYNRYTQAVTDLSLFPFQIFTSDSGPTYPLSGQRWPWGYGPQ